MKAYIMINVRLGSILEVVNNLREIDGVKEAFKAAQNPSKTVKAQLVFS